MKFVSAYLAYSDAMMLRVQSGAVFFAIELGSGVPPNELAARLRSMADHIEATADRESEVQK